MCVFFFFFIDVSSSNVFYFPFCPFPFTGRLSGIPPAVHGSLFYPYSFSCFTPSQLWWFVPICWRSCFPSTDYLLYLCMVGIGLIQGITGIWDQRGNGWDRWDVTQCIYKGFLFLLMLLPNLLACTVTSLADIYDNVLGHILLHLTVKTGYSSD